MKLFKMAYRNVRKYYRHYIIVSIIILFGTVFLLSSVMLKESKANTKTEYNRQKYGTWYVMMSKEEMDALFDQTYEYLDRTTGEYTTKTVREQWENKCKEESNYEYTYVYEQGYLDDTLYGFIAEDSYDLFGMKIIEGNDRSNANDVIINESYAKENQLSVGDSIDIQLNGEDGKYTITGIFTNYNEDLPVIVTNVESGTGFYYSNNSVVTYDMGFKTYKFVYTTYIGEEIVHNTVNLNYSTNPNGSDTKESTTTSSLTFSRLQSFYQMIVLLAIVISVLTTTSLKRRAKESSLLRGIGATTGQLILLTIYEMSIVLTVTTILGIAISYGILHIYGHMMTSQYGFYLYDFSKLVIFLYCIGISVVIIFITFLPMRSAAIGALTGAFEQPAHKMLEGRESKWVPQTSHVMAKRQLRGYSKLSLFLMLFVTFIGIYFITYRAQLLDENKASTAVETDTLYKNKIYNTETFTTLEDSNTYNSFFDEEDTIYTVTQKQTDLNCNGTLTNYNEDFISLFTLQEGEYPSKNDEVLITSSVKINDQLLDINDVTFVHNYIIKIGDTTYTDFYQYNNEVYYRASSDEAYQKASTDDMLQYDEYVMIDGIAYTDFTLDQDEKTNQIYGMNVYDSNGNVTYYEDGEHSIAYYNDEIIGIMVGSKLYHDAYIENDTAYYRDNDQDDYSRANDYTVITDYITCNGIEYIDVTPQFSNGTLTGFYTYKDCDVGDVITINHQDYKVCGIISGEMGVQQQQHHPMWHQSTYIYINNNIYVLNDAYNQISGNEQYTTYSLFVSTKKDNIIYNLYNYFGLENQTFTDVNISTANTASTTVLNTAAFNGPYLLIVIGLGIVLCIGLNINNMLNDIKNYAILHLLGMTREDIIKMHFHMALVMTERCLAFIAAYFFFLALGFKYSIDLLTIIIIVAGILFFFTCAYVFPVMYILKGDLMESLMAEE